MNIRELRNNNLYNLIVTFDDTAWEADKYQVNRSRFLEYTEADVRNKYASLDDNIVKDILKMPCLFLYELGQKNYGYIGYITTMKVRASNIVLRFSKISKISIDDIQNLMPELDIYEGHSRMTELHRTHWAIKKVNLLNELHEYNENLFPALVKPKIFISYSWTSIETRTKVKYLVEQLKKTESM